MDDKPNVGLRPAHWTNWGDRCGVPIDMIVLHVMEGSLEGTAEKFEGEKAGTSSHYGIGKDGTILQFVGEEKAAWHAGNRPYNQRSVGIEMEGFCAIPASFTEQMYRSLLALCRYLCSKYNIPRNRVNIIGHYSVPDEKHPGEWGGAGHHSDPGPYFPWWDRLMDDLNEGTLPC